MTDRNTISQVVESLFEDWIDKNINVHPLAVENMRILEADAIALLKDEKEYCDKCAESAIKTTVELQEEIARLRSLLKEQEGIIKQYQKADVFLSAHGWKWEGR